MSNILEHPLTTVIAGFVLSGILIQLLTRRWQEQHKSLELKTTLVAEISEQVMVIMTSVHLLNQARTVANSVERTALHQQREQEYHDSVLQWEVRSSVIWAKLEAYIPEPRPRPAWWPHHTTTNVQAQSIPSAWWDLREEITQYHTRAAQVADELQQSLTHGKNDAGDSAGEPAERQPLPKTRTELLRRKQEVMHRILRTRLDLLGGR